MSFNIKIVFLSITFLSNLSTYARIIDFDKQLKNSSSQNVIEILNSLVTQESKEKLVVVDFWTSPCPGCNEISSAIKSLEKVVGEKVVFIKVYVKAKYGQRFISTFKIQSVPRILIFKQGQKIEDRVISSTAKLKNLIYKHL